MVRLDDAIELAALDGDDGFVGRAEPLQHDDRRAIEIERQLHVGEHRRLSHCATSSGPRSPAASVAKR